MPKGMPLHHKETMSNAAKVMKGALGHCSPSTMLLIEDGENGWQCKIGTLTRDASPGARLPTNTSRPCMYGPQQQHQHCS